MLRESIRILNPGGFIYSHFGPLYMSAYGFHAHRSLSIPFCQFLFTAEAMAEYVKLRGLPEIKFESINEWSLEAFRQLWSQYGEELEVITLYEEQYLGHLDLLLKYPSCFRSKTACMDNLITSSIELLLKKKH